MKRLWIGVTIAVLVVAAFGVVGSVYAQSPTPQGGTTTQTPLGPGYGRGSGGGLLHEYNVAAWADQLGLTVEDLEARLTEGDRIIDIAAEQDVSLQDFITMKDEVRAAALAAAVADGVITQEQADWMAERGGRMMGGGRRGGGMMGGFGAGGCH